VSKRIHSSVIFFPLPPCSLFCRSKVTVLVTVQSRFRSRSWVQLLSVIECDGSDDSLVPSRETSRSSILHHSPSYCGVAVRFALLRRELWVRVPAGSPRFKHISPRSLPSVPMLPPSACPEPVEWPSAPNLHAHPAISALTSQRFPERVVISTQGTAKLQIA
jgi:hypothetical protein